MVPPRLNQLRLYNLDPIIVTLFKFYELQLCNKQFYHHIKNNVIYCVEFRIIVKVVFTVPSPVIKQSEC